MPLVNSELPLATSPGEPQSTTAGVSKQDNSMVILYQRAMESVLSSYFDIPVWAVDRGSDI